MKILSVHCRDQYYAEEFNVVQGGEASLNAACDLLGQARKPDPEFLEALRAAVSQGTRQTWRSGNNRGVIEVSEVKVLGLMAETFSPGQKVEVSALDPNWSYAGCGHPVVGSKGAVSKKHTAPEGKTAVMFRYGFDAVRGDGSSDSYRGTRPYTLFFPNTCLRAVGA